MRESLPLMIYEDVVVCALSPRLLDRRDPNETNIKLVQYLQSYLSVRYVKISSFNFFLMKLIVTLDLIFINLFYWSMSLHIFPLLLKAFFPSFSYSYPSFSTILTALFSSFLAAYLLVLIFTVDSLIAVTQSFLSYHHITMLLFCFFSHSFFFQSYHHN